MENRRKFLRKTGLSLSSVLFFNTSEPLRSKEMIQREQTIWNLDTASGLTIKTIETFTAVNQTVVRVTASDGSQGYGQVANYHNDITATVLHRMIAGHFLGQDPYLTGALTEQAIESNYKYPWSFVCRAVAGIETALWDLRGKREEMPVCRFLGGSPKPVQAYGSSMRRDITPQAEVERLVRLRDAKGFSAFKVRVGKVNGHDEDQWPGRTEELIPAIRRAVGDDVLLLADGNSCYTPMKAISVGRLMEDNNYSQFEEPCPYWELEWTAEVAASLDMPVSGGEQDNDMAQWKRMINMRAVDIVQPDICYLGGISRTLRVAEMAAQKGLTCVPHSANLSLITVFTLHVMAAIRNAGPYLEYSIESTPWLNGLYEPELQIQNGKIQFPEGPGWGVHIRTEWLDQAVYQKSGD